VAIDAFRGSGSVSLLLKTFFTELYSNDISQVSWWVGQGLLANHHQRLPKAVINSLLLAPDLVGIAQTDLCPSVFSTRHAQALDRWLAVAQATHDPIHQALLYCLIIRCAKAFVGFPTSLGTSNRPLAEALDGVRDWAAINPKRLQDQSVARLLLPTATILMREAEKLNRSVIQGAPVTLYRQDAVTFLQSTPADVVYLDPPYAGTTAYESSNRVLNRLLGEDTQQSSSRFSQSTDSLGELFNACQHIPDWILSYGSKAIDLDSLVALVQQHAGHRKVVGFQKQYTHLAHVSQDTDHHELLVIAISEDTPWN
jgi:hypothetical protein